MFCWFFEDEAEFEGRLFKLDFEFVEFEFDSELAFRDELWLAIVSCTGYDVFCVVVVAGWLFFSESPSMTI